MIRTVLVTVRQNKHTGEREEVYGRFDVVALYDKDYEIVEQHKAQYEMSDSDFVKYGKFKRKVED